MNRGSNEIRPVYRITADIVFKPPRLSRLRYACRKNRNCVFLYYSWSSDIHAIFIYVQLGIRLLHNQNKSYDIAAFNRLISFAWDLVIGQLCNNGADKTPVNNTPTISSLRIRDMCVSKTVAWENCKAIWETRLQHNTDKSTTDNWTARTLLPL